MEIAKTVTGVYVFDGDELVDSDRFDPDNVAAEILETHRLEEEYPDADRIMLDVETIADLSGLSVDEVRALQVQAANDVTRQRLKQVGDRDQLLVQAVRALADMDEVNNDLSERLRPWFAIHFPELDDEIADNEEFAETVAKGADRESTEEYADLAEDSTGIPIDETDAQMLRIFAAHLSNGYAVRDDLEEYVELLAQEIAPNLSELLGGLLAARIISLAGSLEKLAKLPASTIQVLGAEKAMFRHMRGEGSAPKHGVLFMHPFVQNVSNDHSGEMARALANKAAIAARLDQYDGEFKGDELHSEVEERFEALQQG